jgi:hypothetical protein
MLSLFVRCLDALSASVVLHILLGQCKQPRYFKPTVACHLLSCQIIPEQFHHTISLEDIMKITEFPFFQPMHSVKQFHNPPGYKSLTCCCFYHGTVLARREEFIEGWL